jgi:predicted Zn-dependent protease
MTIFKESLYNVTADPKNRNIHYAPKKPELTDEPIALISYVIATRYLGEKKYNQAIDFFWKAIPLEKTDYIQNRPTYLKLLECYFSIGDFQSAEDIILKHLNYKQDDDLLALIGLLRHIRSKTPIHLHKQLADLWVTSSPSDWKVLDRVYLLGITEKWLNLSKARKKDNVDKLINKKLKRTQKKSKALKYLDLQLAVENKDLEKFKKLHSEVFDSGDIDDRIGLIMLASSLETRLAFELIEKTRKEHGDSPALALLESLNCLIVRDIDTAYSLIKKYKVLVEESWVGRYILASYYSIKSENEKSSTILNKLIAENPKVTLFRKLRADINFYEKNNEFVKEDYEQYSLDYPEDTKVLYRLARLSFTENDNTKGAAYLKKLYASKVDAELDFARLLDSIVRKKPLPVKESFMDSEHREKLHQVFELLNKNQKKAALDRLSELINDTHPVGLSNQYDSFYYYVYAFLSFIDIDYSSCIHFLGEALAEYPMDELKVLISDMYILNDKTVSEDKLFRIARTALQKIGDNDKLGTAQTYETAAEEYPTFCYLWLRAGIYRYVAKDEEGAASNYHKALQCSPNAKEVHMLYADILKYYDCNTAIEHYQKSIAIDGESAQAFDGLSQCYEKLGNTLLAEEYYKKYQTLYFELGGNPVNWFFNQPQRGL